MVTAAFPRGSACGCAAGAFGVKFLSGTVLGVRLSAISAQFCQTFCRLRLAEANDDLPPMQGASDLWIGSSLYKGGMDASEVGARRGGDCAFRCAHG